jgi:hypothetical protein
MKKQLILASLIGTSTLFGVDHPVSVSIINQYANSLVHSPAATYQQLKETDTSLKASVDTFIAGTYNLANVPLSYVYKDTFGISAYISYVESDFEAQDTQNGMGDTTIEASYNFGMFDMDDVEFGNNVFGLRYTFDTGDEQKGLGAGAQSVSIFWDSVYGLEDNWTLMANLMWTFYLDDVTIDGITYDSGSEDILWIGVKHPCLLTDKLDTSLKLNWQGRYNDVKNTKDFKANYDIVDITLQWESSTKLTQKFPFRAGVKIPVYASDDVDNEFLFFVGIGGLF